MAYCTSQQIQDAVGGLTALIWITDLENTAVNADAVTSAIEASTGKIDQYATGTPGTGTTAGALWASTPTQAKQCAIDIAVCTLYERIRREVPETVKDARDEAIELLKLLAKGAVSWVTTETPSALNVGAVYYFGPGSTARTANPRRTQRTDFDRF